MAGPTFESDSLHSNLMKKREVTGSTPVPTTGCRQPFSPMLG